MTRITPGLADLPDHVDVLVVGLGATGTGCALDAVSRGLSVLAVDAHDIAFGTSRWSSKLVHGGLRYLANGQLGVAHESAVERGILMEVTAPHLTHPLPMLLPLGEGVGRREGAVLRAGLAAGDLLRVGARTSRETLPSSRRVSATEARHLAPTLVGGLRGGLLSWDGQLEDDARLVTTIARTAARLGAHVRTRARVMGLDGRGATIRDEITGATHEIAARAVVNAAGVWAGQVAGDIRLRPSRGTHLVVRTERLGGLAVALTIPVSGERNRFVFVLPQPDGLCFVGLTDEPVDGDPPDVPLPTETEVDFLLETVSGALREPLTRDDIVGAYAGLRPLLETGHEGRTADLSRRHAVLTSPTGVVTVVGGKLTTYRRMAEDAIDAAVARSGLDARPCRTRRLPLAGAAARVRLDELVASGQSRRLVRRYGEDARLVLREAAAVSGLGEAELLAAVSEGVPVTLAELLFAITHEGAHDLDDLLDRRTRVGLVPHDRALAEPMASLAVEIAKSTVC
jgi:glycerol-3-phosphate dehydrogenase